MSEQVECPRCGRSLRPCNLARHIAAKHADPDEPEERPSVVAAVTDHLRRLRLRGSALGASALRLAEELDNPETPATAKASCTRALVLALERARELTPSSESEDPSPKPDEEKDRLDDLAERRAARRGRART